MSRCVKALERLISLLDLKLEVDDLSPPSDVIWEQVVAVRAEVTELERMKQVTDIAGLASI